MNVLTIHVKTEEHAATAMDLSRVHAQVDSQGHSVMKVNVYNSSPLYQY